MELNNVLFEESRDFDTSHFYSCQIKDLKISANIDLSNIGLGFTDGVYRLVYRIGDKTFIKYFAAKESSFKRAMYLAERDKQLSSLGYSPEDCVGFVKRSDKLKELLTDNDWTSVAETIKAHYPHGQSKRHSKHFYDTVNDSKPGHGIFPEWLFDAWSYRVLKHNPRNFNFIYEETELGNLIIPVKATYTNHVRELDLIFEASLKKVINIVPKERRSTFRAKPGFTRTFAYPSNLVVSEYFYCITPKEEHYIPELNDESIKPMSVESFDQKVVDAIVDTCRNLLKMLKW